MNAPVLDEPQPVKLTIDAFGLLSDAVRSNAIENGTNGRSPASCAARLWSAS
jgi:hypothetical protein